MLLVELVLVVLELSSSWQTNGLLSLQSTESRSKSLLVPLKFMNLKHSNPLTAFTLP